MKKSKFNVGDFVKVINKDYNDYGVIIQKIEGAISIYTTERDWYYRVALYKVTNHLERIRIGEVEVNENHIYEGKQTLENEKRQTAIRLNCLNNLSIDISNIQEIERTVYVKEITTY